MVKRIDIVKEIVLDAGDIAFRYFGKTSSSLKADGSLITEADKVVGEFLTMKLCLNFPKYGVVSEESANSEELHQKEYLWVIDPIDGTASFSGRFPIWGISVGLLRRGEPILGVFYMPALREIYYTDEDIPAYFETPQWGKIPLFLKREESKFDKNSLLLAVSYAHRRLYIDFPGKVRSLGSTVGHICFVARGDAVGTVVKGSVWDIVAGWAILKRAGGRAVFLDGKELTPSYIKNLAVSRLPSHEFILFAPPQNIPKLINRIKKQC